MKTFGYVVFIAVIVFVFWLCITKKEGLDLAEKGKRKMCCCKFSLTKNGVKKMYYTHTPVDVCKSKYIFADGKVSDVECIPDAKKCRATPSCCQAGSDDIFPWGAGSCGTCVADGHNCLPIGECKNCCCTNPVTRSSQGQYDFRTKKVVCEDILKGKCYYGSPCKSCCCFVNKNALYQGEAACKGRGGVCVNDKYCNV